ncbi:MAG: exo-alpha-sialidase [Chloroflexi bacterium]|nr:exo-alpha-sialidase [Chloroflexota bacterium]
MRAIVEDRSVVWQADDDDPIGHACEPRIVRRASGVILVAHRLGVRRESNDGRPHLLRSTDDGASWQDLGRPFDDFAERGFDLRGAAMAELANGDVLSAIIGLDKRLDRPVYNPDGEGLVPIVNIFARSSDNGATWSAPWRLSGQPIPQTASQGLLTLPSGDVLMTFETFKEYDEPGIWRYQGGMLRSRDEGRTWGSQVISAASDHEGDPHDTMWWDPRIARLGDGTLVQFYYAFRHRDGGEGPAHAGWSTDDGWTWTPPTPTSLEGQATYPIALPGHGRRLVAFQQRRTDPGVMLLHYSEDGGRTFDPSVSTVIYSHAATSAPAADGSLSSFDYLISMDRFTFGHPCGVALGPDRVLLVWYAGGLTRTAVHAATVRLEP